MPMILLTVPPGTSASQCKDADQNIKGALQAEGVQGGITIWPVALLVMPIDRLLLEYKSRQDVPDPNRLAQVAAGAAEKVFGIQVEAVVIKLDPRTTGLYITPKRRPGEVECSSQSKCQNCGSTNIRTDSNKKSRRNGNWWFEPQVCLDCSHQFEKGEEVKQRGN